MKLLTIKVGSFLLISLKTVYIILIIMQKYVDKSTLNVYNQIKKLTLRQLINGDEVRKMIEISKNEFKELALVIRQFAIPQNVLGYTYIIYGLKFLSKDADVPISEIYWEIGHSCNTTVDRCERAIRHAINVGYKNCEQFGLDSFKQIICTGQKPSNGMFLKAIAKSIM